MTQMDLCKGNIYINEFPFIYQKKKEKKKELTQLSHIFKHLTQVVIKIVLDL